MSEVAKFFQAAAVAVVGEAAPLMPMQSSRTVMPPSLLQQHRDAGNMARQLARQLAQQLAQQLVQQLVQKLARQLTPWRLAVKTKTRWPGNGYASSI